MRLTEFVCPPQRVPMTPHMLEELERSLRAIWKRLGIEVELGNEHNHFFERINDPRNGQQIGFCEIQKVFVEVFKKYGAMIAKKHPNFEAVMTDLQSNLNIPFMLKMDRASNQLELVAKTIMRKRDFRTPDQKLTVEQKMNKEQSKARLRTLKEWSGLGMPQVAPVHGPFAADDVDTNPYQIEDPVVMSKVNGFLSSLCKISYINPYYPLQQAWNKLSMIGITFPLRGVDLGGEQGTVIVPCEQFGGRMGKDLDGTWLNDDGISHRIPGGLSLRFDYAGSNGEYACQMQLVTQGAGTAVEIAAVEEAFGKTSRPKGFNATSEGKAFAKKAHDIAAKHAKISRHIQEIEAELRAAKKAKNKEKIASLQTELEREEKDRKDSMDDGHDNAVKWKEAHRVWKSKQSHVEESKKEKVEEKPIWFEESVDFSWQSLLNESESEWWKGLTEKEIRSTLIRHGKKIGIDPFGVSTVYLTYMGNVWGVHNPKGATNLGPEKEFRDKVKHGYLRVKMTEDAKIEDFPLDKTFEPDQDGETIFDESFSVGSLLNEASNEDGIEHIRAIGGFVNMHLPHPGKEPGDEDIKHAAAKVGIPPNLAWVAWNAYAGQSDPEHEVIQHLIKYPLNFENMTVHPPKDIDTDTGMNEAFVKSKRMVEYSGPVPAYVKPQRARYTSASGKTVVYRVLFIGKTKFGERAHLQFIDGTKDFWVPAHKVQMITGGGSTDREIHPHYTSDEVTCRFCGKRTPEGDDWCMNCGRAGYED